MSDTTISPAPKLRALDPQPIVQDGRRLILLRDPQRVSDKMVAIPIELAPILALCDGTRDARGIVASLAIRYNVRVSPQIVDRFLSVCDEALLLANDHFHAAEMRCLADYHAAPNRLPSLAGLSYPGQPDELIRLFVTFEGGTQVGESDALPSRRLVNGARHKDFDPDLARNEPTAPGTVSAIISPHIDYARGGPVYSAVWRQAAPRVRAAELAIVFGTDHYGGLGALTLTHQSYATPFGVLPTPKDMVEALAAAIGPENAFANELHHRSEHSIELALTWLHYVRRDLAPVPVLPILCGSFHHFVAGEGDPAADHGISALLHSLRDFAAGRKVIVVAGADLAHVGPAFGGAPQRAAECARVQAADRELMARMCAADAAGFFSAVRQVGDQYNVCGLSPIYLALRLLSMLNGKGDGKGTQVAYAQCPADEADTSFVSICGVTIA